MAKNVLLGQRSSFREMQTPIKVKKYDPTTGTTVEDEIIPALFAEYCDRIKAEMRNNPKMRPIIDRFPHPIIWTLKIKTAASDGVRIAFNPVFANELLELGSKFASQHKNQFASKEDFNTAVTSYFQFVILHECFHEIYCHSEQSELKPTTQNGQNHHLANIAMDAEINRDIERAFNGVFKGVTNKIHGVFDERFPYESWWQIFDEYFEGGVEPPMAEPDWGGTIKAKKIEDDDDANDINLPKGPQIKHSDDYKRGWKDAIKDVVSKAVDPLTYNPIPEYSDYEVGYNDAMSDMKNGLENGVKVSKNQSSLLDDDEGSDLPQIPWDIDNDEQESGSGTSSGDGSSSNEHSNDQNNDQNNQNGQDTADGQESNNDGNNENNSSGGSQSKEHSADWKRGYTETMDAIRRGEINPQDFAFIAKFESQLSDYELGKQAAISDYLKSLKNKGNGDFNDTKSNKGNQQDNQNPNSSNSSSQPQSQQNQAGTEDTLDTKDYDYEIPNVFGGADRISKEEMAALAEESGETYSNADLAADPAKISAKYNEEHVNELDNIDLGKDKDGNSITVGSKVRSIMDQLAGRQTFGDWKTKMKGHFHEAMKAAMQFARSKRIISQSDWRADFANPYKAVPKEVKNSANVFYLIDNSGSMGGSETFIQIFAEILKLEKVCHINKSALTYFGANERVDVNKIRLWDHTTRKEKILAMIPQQNDHGGGTDIMSNVLSVRTLKAPYYYDDKKGHKTLLIVITDGYDNLSRIQDMHKKDKNETLWCIINSDPIERCKELLKYGVPARNIIAIDTNKALH